MNKDTEDTMSGVCRAKGTLGERITVSRHRMFVGRKAQLQTFDALLQPDCGWRVWFVTGPGGVGKTSLLQSCMRRAGSSPVAAVDARNVRSNPFSALKALETAAGRRPFEDFCNGHDAPVLCIDTFERWADLEAWLKDAFLGRMPANLRVVLAGRKEPGSPWTTDPDWPGSMHVTHLNDLSATDAGAYLDLRGVDATSSRTLIEFSGGRPLALALGADLVSRGHPLHGTADTRPVIEQLVSWFTHDVEQAGQRRALDAAAIAREIDASLLACMLDFQEAGELYQWLAGLSFMEAGEHGIFPHDQVREALMLDMPKRAPGRYEAFVQRAFDWIVNRIEVADHLSWTKGARLAIDAMFTMRNIEVVQHFMAPQGARSLYIDHAGDADWPGLARMVDHHEGVASRKWFEFWSRRAPHSVYVVRGPGGGARGFFMKLDMETLAPEERDEDPLTACLWQHLTTEFATGENGHFPFIRFWTSAQHAQSRSPEKTVILMAIHSYNNTADNLRLTAQVFSDTPEWEQQAHALGIARLQGSDTRIGERIWRIYYNDWRLESPTRYYRRFAERCIAFNSVLADARLGSPPAGVLQIEERAFKAAAADALKHFHSDEVLNTSVLLGSALVLSRLTEDAGISERIEMLREQFRETVAVLNARGDYARSCAGKLEQTYLVPGAHQKAVAHALNLPYSTFRRQLADARETLLAELWERESRLQVAASKS